MTVSQSRTPIRVAVTSSNVGHDVKCKRTIAPIDVGRSFPFDITIKI